jgi:hypothetical protein
MLNVAGRGYNGMSLVTDNTYLGEHYQTDGLAKWCEDAGLVRADSMDVVNDPRFFGENVLKYRLEAFVGLEIVSGLMANNAMDQLFNMNKRMPIFDQDRLVFSFNGLLQLICFGILVFVLYQNMLAMYVGLAQPYHTYRLMTAGPTGFDAAASYYLNRNIVSWRHLAIKGMLQSLPLYILQMGMRLIVKFDRETEQPAALPNATPMTSMIQGLCFCLIFQCLAGLLVYIHYKHFTIFAERYDVMTKQVQPLQGFMSAMMAPRANAAAAQRQASAATGQPPKRSLFGWLDV